MALCAAALLAACAGASRAGCRKHVAKITEYGAVGDEKTLNTAAFAKAVADLSARARRGGAALVVPPGKWLTGPFNLTRNTTHVDSRSLPCTLFGSCSGLQTNSIFFSDRSSTNLQPPASQ